MSRSRTNYYNLCGSDRFPIEEDGYCWLHRPTGCWMPQRTPCFGPGEFLTRRGLFRRDNRFPHYSPKSIRTPPPRWFKQSLNQRARARVRLELKRYGEVNFNDRRWIGGKICHWY